jgi:putative ABC transport system permease protein
MVVGPRWRKIWRDLLGNLMRTALVVLSLAVGVFAIGLTLGTHEILSRDLRAGYLAVNPASAAIYTNDPFDKDFVQSTLGVKGVGEAEGRRSVFVRARVGSAKWRSLQLVVIDDYQDIRINKIYPESGAWPPPERSVLIERAALGLLEAEIGDAVLLEMPDGGYKELQFAGLAHDLTRGSPALTGEAYGYITFETLEWLGEPDGFNELYITVTDDLRDIKHIQRIAGSVQDKLERGGIVVARAHVPTPGKHPMNDIIQSLLLILGILGFFCLLLSGFLTFNTFSALLKRQIRQVGIIKAIGARVGQIVGMYLVTAFVYGLFSLVFAIPLGMLATNWLTVYVANLLNFDIVNSNSSSIVYPIQGGVGLVVPLLATLFPIMSGTSVTVHQAISAYGLDTRRFGAGVIDRLVRQVRGFSRPLLLSVRNTFRHKARLVLTLITLVTSCTTFVAVASVRDSLLLTLEETLNRWNSDLMVNLTFSHRVERLEREALSVPGVVDVEVWGGATARRVRADGSESGNITLHASPSGKQTFLHSMVRGRWLVSEDESAIVINTGLLGDEPDIDVGDEIVLKVAGQESSWIVVGIVRGGGLLEGSYVFTNRSCWQRVAGELGRANRIHIITRQHDAEAQAQVARDLEERFDRVGMRVARTYLTAETRETTRLAFDVVIFFLLVMAILFALVGGLSLMGIMSINVLERTREIGVMRAIGADNGAILRIFIVEGVFIGILSWFLGCGIAVPLSSLFSEVVGVSLLNTSPMYRFSIGGVIIWLGLVVVISALASFVPAWNASRVSVRKALAYE